MKAKVQLIGLVLVSAFAAAAFLATLVLIPGAPRGAERACVDEQDLIAWMRDPPTPVPSAEIFMMLRGGHAEVFLQITGGSALATEPRVVYLYHAPTDPNLMRRGAAAAALADASGCLIKMNGERTTSISAGFAGQTMPIRLMCNALAAAGARRWNRCSDLTGMPNGLLNGPAKWERPV